MPFFPLVIMSDFSEKLIILGALRWLSVKLDGCKHKLIGLLYQ